jgi:hypothetical protein
MSRRYRPEKIKKNHIEGQGTFQFGTDREKIKMKVSLWYMNFIQKK